METQNWMVYFDEHYLSKSDAAAYLPISMPMEIFWPELLEKRRAQSISLPLSAEEDEAYRYVPTERFLEDGDRIAELARSTEIITGQNQEETTGLLNEVIFSGNERPKNQKQILRFLRSGSKPKTAEERIRLRHYQALRFAVEHRYDPLNEDLIREIGQKIGIKIRKKSDEEDRDQEEIESLDQEEFSEYTEPPAENTHTRLMALLRYIGDPTIHPILKSSVARLGFRIIYPQTEGYERLADTIAYMILLGAGYDFFLRFSPSALLQSDPGRYAKAVRDSLDPENGYDLTYYFEYCGSVFRKGLESIRDYMLDYGQLCTMENTFLGAPGEERLLRGFAWIVRDHLGRMTTERWQKKHGVSFETARQDLQRLAQEGFLELRTEGHKKYYDRIDPEKIRKDDREVIFPGYSEYATETLRDRSMGIADLL